MLGRMSTITIYQKPTCTTCRQVYAALKDAGIDVDAVNYYTEPLSHAKLRELLRKMNISARRLLRTNEAIYRELRLADRELSEEELIALMVQHPDLMQRPIVEKGNRAVLARPADRVKEIVSL
jgi:arsenate reductase (glutaredoxin)